ncbi:putative gamma-glutamylcyclotransferase CG2811 isoform X2 [Varroa jacobsoni]|uniref:Gamma-glutamylcyclotransferase family protein n=1 Tax=Varroa destructor TaxID=109461 RepID=A0A7M7IXB6_VARDE|nr:putative gamma-glutamylcyclotransferase CG2811 isoform X2 [Varroa destructor]XP_022685950.1 putative gamma-glutamylcyclotransferase CG2811 isoform X2 [Varroa jacobsoni]
MILSGLRRAAMTHWVFVYGTLKKGEPSHHVITTKNNKVAKFVSNGRTVHQFPLVIASSFNIPYLLYKPGTGHRIHGEVYSVNDDMLTALDDLENHPNYYVRQQEPVEISDGSILTPWVYFLIDFQEKLLQKPFLDNYSSSGSHGLVYVDSEDTDSFPGDG